MYLKKYDSKIINAYLNNEKVDDCDFRALQDDENFMREVLMASLNSKLYERCSYKLKLNQDFVLFFIELFIKDENAVTSAIDFYFENINSGVEADEMTIMLASIADKYQYPYLSEYKVRAWQLYKYAKLRTDEIKKRVTNPVWVKELGLGFKIYLENYTDHKLIPFFMAENLLVEYFESFNLEGELHKQFRNSSELKKYGINNYIISRIAQIHHYLSSFLEKNLLAMNHIIDKINEYIKNWDKYTDKTVDNILYDINKCFKENDYDYSYKDKLLIYVVNKLGISNYFLKNEQYIDGLEKFYDNNPNSEFINMEFTPREMVIIKQIEEIVGKYIGNKNNADEDERITYVDFGRRK